MFGRCVGGCRDRLLIDISDHTHCTHILPRRCLVPGSLVALWSLPPWLPISVQDLRRLGHLLLFPIGGPPHTTSDWLSVDLCSIFTVHRCSCQTKARFYCSCFDTRVGPTWHASDMSGQSSAVI